MKKVLDIKIDHEPVGTRFYSGALRKQMMYCHEGQWKGWLVYQHPDGGWVSYRKATEDDAAELAHAISQAHHRAHGHYTTKTKNEPTRKQSKSVRRY